MSDLKLNKKFGVTHGEVLDSAGDFLTVWYTCTPHACVYAEMDELGYSFVNALSNNVPHSSTLKIIWKKK